MPETETGDDINKDIKPVNESEKEQEAEEIPISSDKLDNQAQKVDREEDEKERRISTTHEDQSLIESIQAGNVLKNDLDILPRSQSSPSTVFFAASDYEPLYTALLEWLLNKPPASIEGSVMIDDTDGIKSINVVFIILRLFRQVPESVKQKVI